MNPELSHYRRIGYTFATADMSIDTSDKSLIRTFIRKNASVLVDYYRKHGMKIEAIDVLLKIMHNNNRTSVCEEIMNTFVFFRDFDGALGYLNRRERTNLAVRHHFYLLKIYKGFDENSLDYENLILLIMDGLKYKFHRNFFIAFIEYLKLKHPEDFENKLKYGLIR